MKKRNEEEGKLCADEAEHDPPSNDEEAPSVLKKATIPVFKELPAVIFSKFNFQIDHLDIPDKTTTDSSAFPDAVETVTVPSSSTAPIMRPDIPRLLSPQ